MKERRTCFLNKIIVFRFNKEKDDIRSAFIKTANHIPHVIIVFHSAMKTHLLTNQNARTIQIIL